MSASVNTAFLLGHVGSDPDVRATTSGTRVAKVSLATNHKYNQQERTDWHRLTFFGKLADIVEQWVHKGDKIHVRGRIQYSTTEDQNGGTRYWTDIIVDELTLLGSSKAGAPNWPAKGSVTAADDADELGDLPF